MEIIMTKNNFIPKTSIFIDYSNVYIPGRRLFNINIDPPKLIKLLSKGKNIVHTYLFSSENPNNIGEINFYRVMRTKGIIVETESLVERPVEIFCPNCKEQLMPLNCPNCNEEFNFPPHKSKRIDVRMAAQLLETSHTYDEAIIIGGDQDFIPVIRILRRDKGKKVYIASFKQPLSGELVTEVDGITILDDYIDKIKYVKKPKNP
jgi:uncharacterized LabA/DUF88 family protein